MWRQREHRCCRSLFIQPAIQVFVLHTVILKNCHLGQNHSFIVLLCVCVQFVYVLIQKTTFRNAELLDSCVYSTNCGHLSFVLLFGSSWVGLGEHKHHQSLHLNNNKNNNLEQLTQGIASLCRLGNPKPHVRKKHPISNCNNILHAPLTSKWSSSLHWLRLCGNRNAMLFTVTINSEQTETTRLLRNKFATIMFLREIYHSNSYFTIHDTKLFPEHFILKGAET